MLSSNDYFVMRSSKLVSRISECAVLRVWSKGLETYTGICNLYETDLGNIYLMDYEDPGKIKFIDQKG